jgi:methyltransferase OMS1, mitochondrial
MLSVVARAQGQAAAAAGGPAGPTRLVARRCLPLRQRCAAAAAAAAVAAAAAEDAAAASADDGAPPAASRRAVLLSAAAAAAAAAAASHATAAAPLPPSSVDYDPFAATYDGLDGAAPADSLGLPDLRRALLSRARGHVLELAVGTGLNLPLYDTAAGAGACSSGSGPLFGPSSSWSSSPMPGAPALCSVTGVDLSRGMLDQAARRAEQLSSTAASSTATLTTPTRRPLALVSADGDATARDASAGARDSSVVPLRLVRADAARLPFADASFDTSLDTFSLCVLPDPQQALRELCRVTRVGGKILLLEHSASDYAPLAAYQRATEKVVAATSKGCAWAQDVVGMVERTEGLRVSKVERHLIGGVLVSVEAERVA